MSKLRYIVTVFCLAAVLISFQNCGSRLEGLQSVSQIATVPNSSSDDNNSSGTEISPVDNSQNPPNSSAKICMKNQKEIAFPGAEGHGRCSQGGSGGQVIDVTNLNDDRFDPPVGSLRYCVEKASGPRICNVKVTGWVKLGGWDMIVRHPNVTLNCVANGHAIGIRDGGIFVRASHTIWRNCRILPGLLPLTQNNTNSNGIFFWSDEQGGRTGDHIIANSVIGYTSDDHIAVNAQRVTIQDSILGPSLACLQCGGKGLGLGASDMEISVIRNLQVHTYIRFPEMSSGTADFINNIEYNSNGTPAQINPISGPVYINYIGNVFLKGPSTFGHTPGSRPYNPYQSIRTMGGVAFSAVSKIYVKDNIGRWLDANQTLHLDSLSVPDSRIVWGDNGGIPISSTFIGSGEALLKLPIGSNKVIETVLAKVGPFPRSAFENRVVDEVRNRTGRSPESEAEYGGWSTLSGN